MIGQAVPPNTEQFDSVELQKVDYDKDDNSEFNKNKVIVSSNVVSSSETDSSDNSPKITISSNRVRPKRRQRKDVSESSLKSVEATNDLDSTLSGTWYTKDRFGSFLYVFDVDGYELYYTGTSCDSRSSSLTPCDEDFPCDVKDFPISFPVSQDVMANNNAACDFKKLPPGKYTWRVTGALNPYYKEVSYEFCGMKGASSSEILFAIDCDGHCVPLKASSLEDICNANGHNNLDGDYGIDLKTEVAKKIGIGRGQNEVRVKNGFGIKGEKVENVKRGNSTLPALQQWLRVNC